MPPHLKGSFLRLLIVVLGIVLGQAVLYGPSLTGSKILLPLDLLTAPGFCIPRTQETTSIIPHNRVLSDLVEGMEPHRLFFRRELQSHQMPYWNPCQYAGAPFVTPKLSPFSILGACFESPRILPWIQMLAALVAGIGAYVFCKRTLGVGFRPAVIISWCYPITAFFVLWQGYPLEYNTVWLPWMLFAVDQVTRKATAANVIGLGLFTGLTLVSGQLDVAGQVLLVSGLYGVWCFGTTFQNQWFTRKAYLALGALGLSLGIGFLLAAPDILPAIEYARTGERMMARFSEHREERPPVGLAALPQLAIPTIYGSTEKGSFPIFPPKQRYLPESLATAYSGLLALLLAAPLGWCDRKRRKTMLFFLILGLFAMSWTLDAPGVVTLLRLPGLNMMSHNRLVFATAFSVLVMAAIGLDTLERGQIKRQRWFLVPATILGAMLVWCIYRTLFLPEPIESELAATVTQGKPVFVLGHPAAWIRNLDGVNAVQQWFLQSYRTVALLCGAGLFGWLLLWRGTSFKKWSFWVIGGLFASELLWFGYGRSAQCDPSLYFPRIPALEEMATAKPGRILGFKCFPANLGEAYGLASIQGYDGIDPARLMDLMRIAADPKSPTKGNAWTQWFIPKFELAPSNNLRLSPILDMLNVRYVVFRGLPPASVHPAFQSPDYWILENHSALPRAFVPHRIETSKNSDECLAKLAAPQFDPREVAYVESSLSLPDTCQGAVRIIKDTPSVITLSAEMKTPGLVVLADLWNEGWHAKLDGQPAPILRTNHAVRGVAVPTGTHAIEFRYEPASAAWGWRLAGLGWAVMAGILIAANFKIMRILPMPQKSPNILSPVRNP